MSHYNTANKANNKVMAMSFNGHTLQSVIKDGQIWMTASDLAKALSYKNTKSVTNLFNANSSEFTSGMTMVTESVTNGINGSKRKMTIRIFSLRGCHLIAMFARTKIAKDFRAWVLDILDHEAVIPVAEQPPAITDADWVRYARSMTIPEMAQLTEYSEREVVNALHKVMGSPERNTRPAPVLTPELQYALDQFWGFIATQDIKALNHSQKSHELAISIPEVYALADKGQLPDTSLIYKALRLSDTPRFHRANTVIASAIYHKSRRVWVFIKSFNQPAITNQAGV